MTLQTACSHQRAEPQEGGGIARGWIVDPKVYPRYTTAPMTVFVAEGTVIDNGGCFVKMLEVFVDNTCQALLASQLESPGMAARFGKLSTQKYHQKFKKPSNIYKNEKIL